MLKISAPVKLPELKPGDIGFAVPTDAWFSKAIAKFMGSKWSHTFLVAGELNGETVNIETSDYEVYCAPVRHYTESAREIEVWAPVGLNDSQRADIVSKGTRLIGQTYGYLQLLSLGLRRVLMRLGIRIPNFIRQGLVCCAVPIYGYKDTGIHPIGMIDPESIDTEELYQIVARSPYFKRVYPPPS
jgi:hypothetical protein